MDFEKELRSLLRNRHVLYLVLLLCVIYVLILINKQNFNALVFFIVSGFLTSYFSKNMTLVLLVPLVLTNVLSRLNIVKEGMTGKDKKKGKKDNKDKKTMDEILKAAAGDLDDDDDKKDKKASSKKSSLNAEATKKAAFDNLDNMMEGIDSQEALSALETMVNKQESMVENLKGLEPMLNKVEGMMTKMGGMDKMEGLVNQVGGLMNGFKGMSFGSK